MCIVQDNSKVYLTGVDHHLTVVVRVATRLRNGDGNPIHALHRKAFVDTCRIHDRALMFCDVTSWQCAHLCYDVAVQLG